MNITALVTGRGNNTLSDKNVLTVLGKPLMSYPCIAAKQCTEINNFYVSSDDEKILNVGDGLGFTKIYRPAELATPTAQHIDVIKHALTMITKMHQVDILIVLLANNATVRSEWISQAIQMILHDNTISSVCPVEKDQDHHPYRAKTVDDNGSLIPFFDFKDKTISTNRQDLSPCYFLCHNFWALNLKHTLYNSMPGQQPWTFLGNNIKYIEVQNCFDVHTMDDIRRTEKWILDSEASTR